MDQQQTIETPVNTIVEAFGAARGDFANGHLLHRWTTGEDWYQATVRQLKRVSHLRPQFTLKQFNKALWKTYGQEMTYFDERNASGLFRVKRVNDCFYNVFAPHCTGGFPPYPLVTDDWIKSIRWQGRGEAATAAGGQTQPASGAPLRTTSHATITSMSMDHATTRTSTPTPAVEVYHSSISLASSKRQRAGLK